MLSGQEVVQRLELEAGRAPLGEHLADRHRVVGLDVIAGAVLDAVLEEGDPASRRERPADAGEHGLGVGHLVVDVGDDDPVDGTGRQPRVGGSAEHRLDAANSLPGGVAAHDVEHLGLDVLAVNGPPRLHAARHPPRVVAGTAADVRHDVAGAEAHGVEHALGLLLFDPLGPLEPLCAEIAHELGRHTVALPMARLALVLGRRRGRRRREGERQDGNADDEQ